MSRTAVYDISLKGDFENKLKKNSESLDKFEHKVQGSSMSMKSAFSSLGPALAGALSVGAVVSFGREVLNVTAEFQKLQAVLETTLGSEAAADIAFSKIQAFASKTPFAVSELTDSFVKLANRGLEPTINELTSLGDLASSQGKSFDQLTEALLDASTGEFERLKEFGIKASSEGDRVKFTFKGVTTEVDKTEKSIQQYILSLGKLEGVTGGMAKISETLEGKISNLGDSWDSLLFTIGTNTGGVFGGAIDLIGGFLNNLEETFRSSEQRVNLRAGEIFAQMEESITGLNLNEVKTKIDELNMSLEETEKAISSLEESRPLRGRAASKWMEQNKAALEELKAEAKATEEQLRVLNKQSDLLSGKSGGEEGKGLINSLRDQIKSLTKQRDDARSVQGIREASTQIEAKQAELDRLLGKNPNEKSKGSDKAGLQRIEGKGTRNITINIDKLIESVDFMNTDFQKNKQQLMNEITRGILMSLNDTQIMTE